MGIKDLAEKDLESYPEVAAELINVLLYNGNEVVNADNLQKAPTESLYRGAGNKELRNQFQDKSYYDMRKKHILVQYTFENQTEIDRKMLFRSYSYQGGIYREQIDGSGKKTYPVISMILYWGEKRWSSSRSLKELFIKKKLPSEIVDKIDDINLHIYEMRYLPDKVRRKFHSDIRIIVDYLAKGKEYQPTKQKIEHIAATCQILKALSGDNRYEEVIAELLAQQEKGDEITMCELIDKYEKRGIAIGEIRGQAKEIIQTGFAFGASVEAVTERLKKVLDIDDAEAQAYMQIYQI